MNNVIETPVAEITTQELEQILAARKAAEKQQTADKRKQYENEKDAIITAMGLNAENLAYNIAAFKGEAFTQLEGFYNTMQQYGDVKGGDKNKGNFELKNNAYKIIFCSQVKKCFDERSLLAESKLKEFLEGFVKTANKKLYKLILYLLERNSVTGELDITNINRLYKMEEDFEDPSWREAIKLFKESYNPTGTTKYIRFYKKNKHNGWDLLNLNFASV